MRPLSPLVVIYRSRQSTSAARLRFWSIAGRCGKNEVHGDSPPTSRLWRAGALSARTAAIAAAPVLKRRLYRRVVALWVLAIEGILRPVHLLRRRRQAAWRQSWGCVPPHRLTFRRRPDYRYLKRKTAAPLTSTETARRAHQAVTHKAHTCTEMCRRRCCRRGRTKTERGRNG